MKTKNLLLIFILLAASSNLFAQTSGKIRGRITNAENQPVAGATITLENSTRLIDTPQSITSVSPQLIADRLATDVNDIYKNVAGLNQTTYSAVVFRGFTQRETLFNGVRGNPYGSLEGDVNNAGFSISILRLSNVERVEVLKGPASVLYGSSDPGGVINFITNRFSVAFAFTPSSKI